MGQVSSYIEEHIENEFARVKKSEKRDYLTVQEAKNLKSLEDMPINFSKLAVLFMLDFDKNGKFSLDDLKNFANWCANVTAHLYEGKNTAYSHLNFESELQANCTLTMWKQVLSSSPSSSAKEQFAGQKAFSDWFVKLFSTGMIVRKFVKPPQQHTENRTAVDLTPTKSPDLSAVTEKNMFLRIDAVVLVHELLSVHELYGLDSQALVHVMQRVGEDIGLLNINDEDLDDVVPIPVLQLFAENFIAGFVNMMSQLGFTAEKYIFNKNLASPPTSTLPSANSESHAAMEANHKLEEEEEHHKEAMSSDDEDDEEEPEQKPQPPKFKIPALSSLKANASTSSINTSNISLNLSSASSSAASSKSSLPPIAQISIPSLRMPSAKLVPPIPHVSSTPSLGAEERK